MARQRRLHHDGWLQRLQRAGFGTGSENAAWNQRTPALAVDSWSRSAGHRANLLGRAWRHCGSGVAVAADGSRYWCALYAR
jgi:uncharacterized protein YkwD